MKHGHRLTKRQKILLAGLALNPADWLYHKRTPEGIEFIHRRTGRLKLINRELCGSIY